MSDLPIGYRYGLTSMSATIVHITDRYRVAGEDRVRYMALCGESLLPSPVASGDVCPACERQAPL